MILFEPKHENCTQAVKWHLKRYGSITQLQCLKKYHSWKLSRIVGDLKRQGMDIRTTSEEVETKWGYKAIIAIYHFTG